MEDLSSAPAGEQPLVTPDGDAGEQPHQQSLDDTLDSMPLSDLRAVLDGEFPTKPKTENPPPAAEVETETKPGEQPAAEVVNPAAVEPATPETPRAPSRIRIGALPENDQTLLTEALDLVKTGKATDLASAILTLKGPSQTIPDAGPASSGSPAGETTAPAPKTVESLSSELDALYEQQDQAAKDFDRPTELKIERQIHAKREEIAEARHEAREQTRAVQDAQTTYHTQFSTAVDAIEERYEAARDDDSAFSRILNDRVTAARARGDQALADPTFISRFADEVATDLGIKPKSGAPAPIPLKPVEPIRPVGSTVAPGNQGLSRTSKEQAISSFEELSAEEQARVLDSMP